MALSDKNIIITPNISSSNDDPKVVFTAANTTSAFPLTIRSYPTNSGTLSFEGGAGQLFSISNNFSGTIYSVNDISGIPSIEVLDTGLIKLAQYSGNIAIGQSTASYKFDLSGSANISGNLYLSGGAANQLHYQTTTGSTGFITAPSNGTFLYYTTASGFQWSAATGVTVGNANVATYSSITTATTGTYYPTIVSATSGNLQEYANSALSFNAATGALSATSFSGAGTGLTGTASSLSVGTATNIAGGTANQIAYQTGAGATNFITAPSNGTFLYYTTASGFQWTVATGASVGNANIAAYSTITSTSSGTYYPTLVNTTSGNLQEYANSALSFNAATGALSATSFSGAGTGLTGTAASLTAGAVSSITSGQVTTALGYTPSRTAISSNTNSLISSDTRTINPASNTYNAFGLYQDFKSAGTIGISGSFADVLTIVPWADDSGGGNHQLAFSDTGNIYYRYGTRTSNWGSWYTNIHSGNYTNYSIPSSGGTFSGSVTIAGDLSVTGNTTFTGNTSYINVTNLRVSDPVIYLGANNYSSDLVSIGFVGNYKSGANQLHTGLFRAPATNNYYLFTGVSDELDNVNSISTSANGWMLATLNANISGPLITATGQFSGPGTGLTGTASSLTAGSATTATNITGGTANQIAYQTGAGATGFITAPSNGTFLYYTTGGGFQWTIATGASVGNANIASYEVVTTATTGTYYPALYTATSGNLPVSANGALSFNAATGALTATSFSGAGTGLTGTASSLSIGGTATTATNIAGGAANQIHYQTGAGATSFITAPSNGTFLFYTTGGGFQWTVATGASVGNANVATYETVTTATTGTYYPALYSAITGNLPVNANSALSFNAATGALTATSFSGAGTGLTGTASSLSIGGSAGSATTATNIAGGTANQIHYQTGAGATSFITAPSNGTFLYYTTASGFQWTIATGASVGNANLASYEVVTNTSTGTYYPALYSAISGNLPVNANNALSFNAATGALTATSFSGAGTGLTGTASSLTVGTATTATNISGGAANQIHYQTGAGATNFITAPSNGTFLYYTTGGGFQWTVATGASVGNANLASYEVVTTATTGTYYPALYSAISGNLPVSANGALSFNAATGALTATSFSGAGTGLTGTASSLSVGTATNIAGGTANQIAYQTGAGATNFITAPSNGTFLYYSTAGGFSWQQATAAAVGNANVASYEVVTNTSTGTYYPALYSATSGNLPVNANNQLSFNAANSSLGIGSTQSFAYMHVGTLSASYATDPSNSLATFSTSANSYNQILGQNKSNGTLASNDMIVSNDLGSDVSFYGDFGINSSRFVGTGPFSEANGVYLYSASSNLAIGTFSTNYLKLGTNNSTDLSIDPSGNVSIGADVTSPYLFNVGGTANTGALTTPSVSSLSGVTLTVDSGTTGALNIGTGTNAKTITLGNATGATAIVANSGTGGITFNQVASGQFKLKSIAAPTVDLMQITNAGFPTTTAGTSAIQIDYYGGAAAVEASASRVNMNAGNTAGGIWNAFRIAPNWAANTGVVQNGIKFDTISTAGAGTDNMIMANTGWDNILSYGNIPLINGTGQINASQILTGTVPTASLGSGTANSTTYLRGDSTWATISTAASIGITNDTAGATVVYPLLSTATSGTLATANTSNTKLSYTPSTGTLNTTALLTSSVASLAATALSVDSGTTGALNIGTTASAKTITLGNATGATALIANSGTGGIIFNQVAGGQFTIKATGVPSSDMVTVTNLGFPVTTAGVNNIELDYYGGSAAVEAGAQRIALYAGNTAGGVWNAVRIVPAYAAAPSVVQNGIKFDTIAVANTGTDNMILANTGWDNILNYNNISLINGTGQINASQILTGTVPTASLGSGTANANTYLTGASTWAPISVPVRQAFTATQGQTSFTISGGYSAGNIDVYRNGVKLVNGTDVTVSSGTAVVLTVGANLNDSIEVVGTTSTYTILGTINAGNLTGTIPSAVLGASTLYVGTTAIALNRASASQSLTGITSIDGTANAANNLIGTNNYQVGSLGVGTPPSGVSGEIRASNNITAYYSSDINLKENIVNITNPIEKIHQINGVMFDWKDFYINERGGEDGFFVRKHDTGVIAQEIEQILPEIVVTRGDGYKAVNYEKLIPLLIESVKDQQIQIDILKDEINILKERLK